MKTQNAFGAMVLEANQLVSMTALKQPLSKKF
jgi:hypothetical protein